MFKKIFALLLVLFVAVSFVSCDDEEEEKSLIDDYPMGEMTEEESNGLANLIVKEVDTAYTDALLGSKRSDSSDINWTSDDGKISVSGTVGEGSDGSFSVDLQVKFKDYETENFTLFGTMNYKIVGADGEYSASMDYEYSGDFKVLYKEKRYDYSWNIKITFDTTAVEWYTCEGTYTCNGDTYTYKYDPFFDPAGE